MKLRARDPNGAKYDFVYVLASEPRLGFYLHMMAGLVLAIYSPLAPAIRGPLFLVSGRRQDHD
jgi:hypothetical protein